ncbi:MAG TPA: hypothetical protein VIV34_08585 [Pseudolabrys sp.]
MREIFILAGLLAAAALFTGTPAKADVGCGCVKLGSPSVCTATVADCNMRVGGVCLAPCDYQPPKKARMHKKKKKAA